MNVFKRIKHAIGIFAHYYVKPNPAKLGYFGKGALLGIPADLKNPKNIFLHDFARIGRRSTIMTMDDSKFIMKRNSEAAEGLIVITSNHKQKAGTFRTGSNEDNLYRDIIVEEDVWIGINVTLLSGTHIGRGAIVGAGAVVRMSVPPYAVVVGNPARVIKFKWSIEDILEHEKVLYPEHERFSREQLEQHRESFESDASKQ
jgi:acetyltransferase-like isoleucine patch superfamily enzyme